MNEISTDINADTDIPSPKVLIVDDTPENLVALEVVLEDSDCEVICAGSGNDALGKLLKSDFALVLLDVQMPIMDGFEVAELMRANKRTAHVPIIFVTANSRDDRNVKRGYLSGAVDYLFKPIDPVMLCSKVEFFLQLDRQKRRLEAKLARARASEKAMNDAYGN
ncbi:MAG: response regulator [Gammaproteobacteria bacterium]|nr:response regulator [Gammaproteobacteria bacterium]MBQ0774057.1 response regulator [Gammaproteobacteria bacterium]|tara:strand:+ start:103450 stop:103944 length:495 start_codon:yes stop_codon:yes gene_type:complete